MSECFLTWCERAPTIRILTAYFLKYSAPPDGRSDEHAVAGPDQTALHEQAGAGDHATRGGFSFSFYKFVEGGRTMHHQY